MVIQTTAPKVHITNYQQYIDAHILQQLINDNLPRDVNWPLHVNVSIAYMDVKKKGVILYGTIALSILGKTYKVSAPVEQEAYLAKYGLDLGVYFNQDLKDSHIHILQNTFAGIIVNKKQ